LSRTAPDARLRRRLAALALAAGALTGVGLALFAYLLFGSEQRGLALPSLHGQASWSPGEQPAPAFELRDHEGTLVSFAALRDRPILLTFFDSQCVDQCPLMGRELAIMLRRMRSEDRPTLLIVSVNPAGDTPTSIRRALANWRLAGPWRLHWLRGTKSELAAVWRDYGVTVDPTTRTVTHGLPLYLIDGRGFQRTGYLFPFLPNFVALDLKTLREEVT
jgi:cytochrome oxidase Cu insertion factor (SCO1/SenC/PrrC family)